MSEKCTLKELSFMDLYPESSISCDNANSPNEDNSIKIIKEHLPVTLNMKG